MSPEDCYWLINNMIDRFPGLITGAPVAPRELVEWVSYRVIRDPLLESIARGSSPRADDSDMGTWFCPVCGDTSPCPELHENGPDLRCPNCSSLWTYVEEDE